MEIPSTIDKEKQRHFKSLLELFVVSFVLFMLGVLGPYVNTYLDFDRAAITSGEWWRFITASSVHLSVNHMLLNVCGYIIASLLFRSSMSATLWYSSIALCVIAVGAGIFFFDTHVQNYVGLSGALYGILAFGIILNLKDQVLMYLAVYAFLVYRVIEQHRDHFDPSSMHNFIGGDVIASSHLFGLIMGNVFACLIVLYRKYQTYQKSRTKQ